MIRGALAALLALGVTPGLDAAQFQTAGADTASSQGTSITCSENTPGSWVEFTASTNFAVKQVYLFLTVTGTNSTSQYALDIGTGAATSETVVVDDIFLNGFTSSATYVIPMNFRLDIAASTRVVMRCEGSAGGGTETLEAVMIFSDTEIPNLTSPTHTVYGITAGQSAKATTIDCGGTAHTKPTTFSELTASASSTAQHFYILVGSNQDGTMADAHYLLDLATGASGSETVLISNMAYKVESVVDTPTPFRVGPFPGDSLQSARVSMRCQSSTIDTTDRVLGVSILVVSGTVPAGGGGAVLGAPNKRGNKQH